MSVRAPRGLAETTCRKARDTHKGISRKRAAAARREKYDARACGCVYNTPCARPCQAPVAAGADLAVSPAVRAPIGTPGIAYVPDRDLVYYPARAAREDFVNIVCSRLACLGFHYRGIVLQNYGQSWDG